MIEPMLEKDTIEAVLEFASRGAMLVWYLREFANRRNVGDVQVKLTAEKKVVEDLRAQLEALTPEHKGCGMQQSKLQEDLDEVHGELSITAQQLKDTRSRSDQIVEEAGRLKLEAKQLAESEKELQSKVDHLTEEVERANEAIATLNTNDKIEHEEGFNKALRQAAFLLGRIPWPPVSTSAKTSAMGR
ncbi:hypothetical protein LR48_Vigan02g087400 [Vigna angularis]|uniref:Uncharacterized protein n=1 Tax=Phaseolus angularis TaxID=3914 RepID=A0A0L9TX14_PHAAN|nr:hypothetical protein LR48_Vigan02g087400 [Vigna angularis]